MHLYLHVPFCARRCSYCDFAIAVRRETPTDAYVEAVSREWERWQDHPAWAAAPEVKTVYFGGGTPSRLDPGGIARILERIAGRREIAPGAEVTLEANPEDVTPAAAAAWRAAGINRISLGVQSFDPLVLRWMHRTHSAKQVPAAVEIIRQAGIGSLSLDLIFGLPASLHRDWEGDLAQALALEPEHLSLYGLTVEERTPLDRWIARGEVAAVDERRYAAEFLTAHGRVTSAGYEHYEVSNLARPGHQARHNSAYWTRDSFIGLGPAAHSGFGASRQWNLRDWTAYLAAVTAGESAVVGQEELDAEAVALEEIYLGLRTSNGLADDRLPLAARERWEREGWAQSSRGRIRLTAEGWLRLDALTASVSG
ncbi:MAG TPA: radical SAM family heme chaperone HemW [Gemmatimonadales bacterium]|jgi:oxygen-independent coproporphyrinogen-3 oxidase|nr:radical SAM family heme chaperone HemW [Gemmatimonadales bacterium]